MLLVNNAHGTGGERGGGGGGGGGRGREGKGYVYATRRLSVACLNCSVAFCYKT